MQRVILLTIGLFILASYMFATWVWRPISATHPAIAKADLPEIIPLRALYANKDVKNGYSLSADGRKMAWLEVEWFKQVIKVRDFKTDTISTLKLPKHAGRWVYFWAPDGHSMILVIDRSGKEQYEIAVKSFEDKASKWRFFDFGENTTSFIQFIPKAKSDEIIIAHNAKSGRYFEFYRLDLKSGNTKSLGAGIEGQQVVYAMDNDGTIFGRTLYPDNQGNWIFETGNPDKGWKELVRGTYKDGLNLYGNPNEDGEIYGLSNIGLETKSFVKFNLETGSQEILFSDDKVDVGWLNINTHENVPLMVKTYHEIVETHFLDEKFKEDAQLLEVSDTAEIKIKSNTEDYSKSIYEIFDIKTGSKTVLLNRETNKVETLSHSPLEPYRNALPLAEPLFIKAEDGLEIPSYLYRPKGITKAAPMVIIVHGGPVSRHYANTDINFISMLTNRGYAVLDVNYRGSWGYGRKFADAAKGEIAGKMSSDIIDARNWAVEQGIADPEKIGIFGISWGGFEVMTALTQNSDLFAAGININGVADLSTMHQEVPKLVGWDVWKVWLSEHAANPETLEGQQYLQARSPIYHVEHMKTPLLIVQAGNDTRVVQGQSDRLVAELEKHKAPFEYKVIPGVGHSPFSWPWQKKYLLYHDIERFLAKHLCGRADGFDFTILGAHILPE